jgi:hypothetical protein
MERLLWKEVIDEGSREKSIGSGKWVLKKFYERRFK